MSGAVIDAVYRTESRRVLATLIRLLGDFDRAEEALHDAFSAAVEQWPRDGVPASPRAWLVSAGRFRAIDALRRRARFDASLAALAAQLEGQTAAPVEWIGEETLEDDRLRLIFTCCHPALQPDAQVALTLREVCGLTTEEIARAFLTAAPTVAQRIVRAKAKIRDAAHPLPGAGARRAAGSARCRAAGRLSGLQRGLLGVVGRLAHAPRPLRRGDPAGTAAGGAAGRAGGRGPARADAAPGVAARARGRHPTGEVVLLDAQDRSRWDRALIAEGVALVERALGGGPPGPYALQAAIAAVHADAASADRHGLGADRRPLRRAAAGGPVARRRAQSRGCRGHA